jgi:hypothetical protein
MLGKALSQLSDVTAHFYRDEHSDSFSRNFQQIMKYEVNLFESQLIELFLTMHLTRAMFCVIESIFESKIWKFLFRQNFFSFVTFSKERGLKRKQKQEISVIYGCTSFSSSNMGHNKHTTHVWPKKISPVTFSFVRRDSHSRLQSARPEYAMLGKSPALRF